MTLLQSEHNTVHWKLLLCVAKKKEKLKLLNLNNILSVLPTMIKKTVQMNEKQE